MNLRTLFFLIIILSKLTICAQETDLEQYEWNKRIVLIVAKDQKQSDYVKQLKELEKNIAGFSERKLLAFEILPNKFRKINFQNTKKTIGKWQYSTTLFEQFYSKKNNFKAILIGLDGGIKRVFKDEVLQRKILFEIIDGMAMRRAELRDKK